MREALQYMCWVLGTGYGVRGGNEVERGRVVIQAVGRKRVYINERIVLQEFPSGVQIEMNGEDILIFG